MLRVWYSTEEFAKYVIANTEIKKHKHKLSQLYESDANRPNDFHTVPDHIKKILYLDAPDLIIEYDNEPICSIEVSTEAGTGHNVFQRFPRIVASAENRVPSIYIFPEAGIVKRGQNTKWDKINPNIVSALERTMQIHGVPALLFYHPTDYPTLPSVHNRTKGMIRDGKFRSCPDSKNPEMRKVFSIVNLIVKRTLEAHTRIKLLQEREIVERRSWMQSQYAKRGGQPNKGSPFTSTKTIDTKLLIDYLKQYNRKCNPEFLTRKKKTVLYYTKSKVRGDPFPGALASVDYLMCRIGQSFEDRDKNLVLVWGTPKVEGGKLKIEVSTPKKERCVEAFMKKVRIISTNKNKSLLDRKFKELKPKQIPRYYLHVRYGSTFTKTKDIRCYSYFADAILFYDGAFWREG